MNPSKVLGMNEIGKEIHFNSIKGTRVLVDDRGSGHANYLQGPARSSLQESQSSFSRIPDLVDSFFRATDNGDHDYADALLARATFPFDCCGKTVRTLGEHFEHIYSAHQQMIPQPTQSPSVATQSGVLCNAHMGAAFAATAPRICIPSNPIHPTNSSKCTGYLAKNSERQKMNRDNCWVPQSLTPLQVEKLITKYWATVRESSQHHPHLVSQWNQANWKRYSAGPLPQATERGMDLDLLKKRHVLLHKVLFGGLIPGKYCTFEFFQIGTKEWKGLWPESYGVTKTYGNSPSNVQCKISIAELETVPHHYDTMADCYTETLVHELLHALTQVYICSCVKCSERNKPKIGRTGHGPMFMRLIAEAAKTIHKIFGIDCEMGRHVCMASELCASGCSIKKAELEKYGLQREQLEEVMSQMTQGQ